MDMNAAAQALGLEPGGQALLTRLGSYELEGLLNAIMGDPVEQRKDTNLWMEAAQAHALRELVHDFAPAGGQKVLCTGTLWKLWNGQFFWTSADGKSWDAVPIKS